MADLDQLQVGLSVGAWTVGLAVSGIAMGALVEVLFNQFLPVDPNNSDLLTTKMPGLRTILQLGIGTVALANLMAFLLPPDAVSPVGDASLYFFFFMFQVLDFYPTGSSGLLLDVFTIFVSIDDWLVKQGWIKAPTSTAVPPTQSNAPPQEDARVPAGSWKGGANKWKGKKM